MNKDSVKTKQQSDFFNAQVKCAALSGSYYVSVASQAVGRSENFLLIISVSPGFPVRLPHLRPGCQGR